jgi:hypothetical protein
MSSGTRRGGGEDNILAMLDRDAGRARFGTSARTVWIAGGAGLVGIVFCTLAWLLYQNLVGEEQHHVYQAVAVPEPAPVVSKAAASLAATPMPSPSARIVDVPQTAVREPAAIAAPAPAAPVPEAFEADRPALVQLSKKEGTARPSAPARHPARVHQSPGPRIVRHPANLASTSAEPDTHRATRARKPAAPSEKPVDNDVAVISAILTHAGNGTDAVPASQCAAGTNKRCRAPSSSEP